MKNILYDRRVIHIQINSLNCGEKSQIMKSFSQYIDNVNSVLNNALDQNRNITHFERMKRVLDGEPSEELRNLVPISDIKKSGAFFTEKKLTDFALSRFLKTINHSSVILDPACGVGDLLIPCLSRLLQNDGLSQNLEFLDSRIIGRDIHEEFIKLTKIRLVLSLIQNDIKIGPYSQNDFIRSFKNIKLTSSIVDQRTVESSTHILLNPPYTNISAGTNCTWGSGKINYAAVFLERCVKYSRPGTNILAILPDVLRSGSRYKKWREIIAKNTKLVGLKLYGQFSMNADVDVFILECIKKESNNFQNFKDNYWQYPTSKITACTKNLFDVYTGPVVDYRDEHEGPEVDFLKPVFIKKWGITSEIKPKRKYRGKLSKPPFLVIQRTSRFKDKSRASATVVNSKNLVAVENHLFVLKPIDNTVETCIKMMKILKNKKTDNWINSRIRCRHLTIEVIKNIPLWNRFL